MPGLHCDPGHKDGNSGFQGKESADTGVKRVDFAVHCSAYPNSIQHCIAKTNPKLSDGPDGGYVSKHLQVLSIVQYICFISIATLENRPQKFI